MFKSNTITNDAGQIEESHDGPALESNTNTKCVSQIQEAYEGPVLYSNSVKVFSKRD